MRSALVFGCSLALAWLVFAISPASGAGLGQQTATAAPTNTWQPLFPSSTPVPTRSYACPGNVPEGWGTLTPGLLWSANCGTCLLTQTVQPSPTWDGSSTPPPTATATSVSPSNNGDEVVVEIWQGSGIVANFNHVSPPGYWEGRSLQLNTQIQGPVIGAAFALTNLSGSCNLKRMNSDLWTNTSDTLESLGGYYVSLPAYTSNEWLNKGVPAPWSSQAEMDTWIDLHFGLDAYWLQNGALILPEGDAQVDLYWEFGWYCAGQLDVYPVALIGVGALPLQETPPSEASYCASVQGFDPLDSGGLGVELPQILVGEAQCSGLGAITIPFSILNLIGEWEFSDLVIPGISVCFRPVSFGTLQLFGVAVDLDLMVLLMSGALVLRWMLRS